MGTRGQGIERRGRSGRRPIQSVEDVPTALHCHLYCHTSSHSSHSVYTVHYTTLHTSAIRHQFNVFSIPPTASIHSLLCPVRPSSPSACPG